MNSENPQNLAFYKPNKNGTGGAFQFKLSSRRIDEKTVNHSVFIEAAKQNGPGDKSFDWKTGKAKMKLNLNDIGQIKAVLEKREKEVNLFHKSPRGISTLKLSPQPEGRTGYYLNITNKPNEGTNLQVSIPLTTGDASNLLDALRFAVVRILNWSAEYKSHDDKSDSKPTEAKDISNKVDVPF